MLLPVAAPCASAVATAVASSVASDGDAISTWQGQGEKYEDARRAAIVVPSFRGANTTAVEAAAGPGLRGADAMEVEAAAATRALQQAEVPRAVFWAGLEGSGHHFLESVYKELQKNDAPLGDCCDAHRLVHGISGAGTDYNSETLQLLANMFKSESFSAGKVTTLSQQLSYPYCGGGNHSRRMNELYPRIDKIADVARQANVDLHVIFMYRHIAETLIAGCIHRHFEGCTPYVETLAVNAEHLTSQLAKLQQSHVHCHRYGDVQSMAGAVNAAYGPVVHSDSIIARLFSDGPAKVGQGPMQDVAKYVNDTGMQRLRQAEAKLQAACHAAERRLSADIAA